MKTFIVVTRTVVTNECVVSAKNEAEARKKVQKYHPRPEAIAEVREIKTDYEGASK